MAKYSWRSLKTMRDTLSAALRAKTFVVFDVETSGVESKSYITQFAGKKFTFLEDEMIQTDELMVYIKIPVLLSQKLEKITGITNEFLVDKNTEDVEVDRIATFFSDVDCIIGHNIEFDIDKMQGMWDRQNKGQFVFPYMLDTLEMARDLLKLKSYKLGDIAKYFGLAINEGDFHNAFYDVLATASIFQVFLKMYIEKADKVFPESDKKGVYLNYTSWWEGYYGNSQVNAFTSEGKIWFNQKTKNWLSDQVDLSKIDMEQLVIDVYKKTGTNKETLQKWRGNK